MVWLFEKKIFHHLLDYGFERMNIPIRVKYEFEVRDGHWIPDSLQIEILYNRQILNKRFPGLGLAHLDQEITDTIQRKIRGDLADRDLANGTRARSCTDPPWPGGKI